MISGQDRAPSVCHAPPTSAARSMLVARSCRRGQGAPLRGFPSAYDFRLAAALFGGGLVGRQELLHCARRLSSHLGGCNVCMLRRFSALRLDSWIGLGASNYCTGVVTVRVSAKLWHSIPYNLVLSSLSAVW